MTTSADVVNRALELIDSQATITSLDDGSIEANAAKVVYSAIVQLLLRQTQPDFSFTTAALVGASYPIRPIPPWLNEYIYPADCLRARQVRPPPAGTTGAAADPFDPLPVLAQIGFDPNGGGTGTLAKVILTNQQNAWLSYTTSAVVESQWDPAFSEAVSRRLANPLAMAIAGRPDFAREVLEESERYAGMSELADDSADGVV